MNLIIDRLPESVEINGTHYPISWDFRTGIIFELLMTDDKVERPEKVENALALYFPYGLPDEPLEDTFRAMLWFYGCGKEKEKEKNKKEKEKEEENEEEEDEEEIRKDTVFSYEYDADYIYAAFLTQYGIDLADAEGLHWWKFQAMFRGLSPDCTFCKIMGYRAAKFTSNMSSAEREKLRKMKKLYALPISEKEQEEQDALIDALKNGGDLSALLGGDADE